MTHVRWTIGDVVRKLRADHGWTQKLLAARAGIAATAVNRLETKGDHSDQRTIRRAAAALNVSVSLLYRYAEFTSVFAELNEAQQGRVLDLMREFAALNARESLQLAAPAITAATPTAAESEPPAQARRRK